MITETSTTALVSMQLAPDADTLTPGDNGGHLTVPHSAASVQGTAGAEMDPVSTILMLYVFPVQLVVGVAGNALNLVVLLSKGMRTKTNILLASMAFADICFLLFMIPHTLMYNNAVTQYHWMKWYNVYLNTHVTGVANSFSIASAWFIVMVTIERLMVIMWPLKARNFWKTKRLVAVIALIWIASFTITLHYHIAYEVHSENKTFHWIDANGTNCSRPMVRKQSRVRPGMGDYNQVAVIINILIVILIPLVVLATVNGLLVYCLRRQQKHMFHTTKGDRAGNSDNNNVISNPKRQQRAQRKVTIMVIVIVSAFTVTNLPSAVIHLYELMRTLELNTTHIPAFQTAATIANSFVVTGKTLNFFLFCMSSAHFRLRLLRIIARKAPALVSCLHKFAPSVFSDPVSEFQRGATNNSTRISTVHMMTTASPPVGSPGHHSRVANNGTRTNSSASNPCQVIAVSADNDTPGTSGRNRALNSDKLSDEEETSFSVVPLLSAPRHSKDGEDDHQVRSGVGDMPDK